MTFKLRMSRGICILILRDFVMFCPFFYNLAYCSNWNMFFENSCFWIICFNRMSCCITECLISIFERLLSTSSRLSIQEHWTSTGRMYTEILGRESDCSQKCSWSQFQMHVSVILCHEEQIKNAVWQNRFYFWSKLPCFHEIRIIAFYLKYDHTKLALLHYSR